MSQLSLSLALSNPAMRRGVVPDAVVNLLDGLTWTAGANTTLTDQGTRWRVARNGANPRGYWHVTELTIGATYKVYGNGWKGTSTNIVLRAAADATISNGDDYDSGLIPNDHLFDATFVSSRTDQYIGFIGTTTTNGQYAEINKDFRFEYVSGP